MEVQLGVVVDRQAVFVGQGHGVGDLTAFADRVAGGEFCHHFVDGVSDFYRGIATQLQVFEGAAINVHCRLDTQAYVARVFVNVIALSSVLIRHAGLASLDGDLSVIAQGHDQVVRQCSVDLYGEGWFDVLGNRSLVGGDGDLHQIALVASAWSTRAWFVSHSGADRSLIQGQLFELADVSARYRSNRLHDGVIRAHIDVVWRGNGDRAGGAVRRNGDGGFAIVQGEGQGAVIVDRQTIFVGQRHGVGDVAAFGDRRGRGQLGDYFVDGIGNFYRRIAT